MVSTIVLGVLAVALLAFLAYMTKLWVDTESLVVAFLGVGAVFALATILTNLGLN